jgi:hypothetical protein
MLATHCRMRNVVNLRPALIAIKAANPIPDQITQH